MYNIRFYIQDGVVLKCDYRKISKNDELDIMFYDEIELDKTDLFNCNTFFNMNCANQSRRKFPNYVLYEYEVPEAIIKQLNERSKAYKKSHDTQIINIDQKINNKFTKKSIKRKVVRKKEDKYFKKQVIASLVTVVTLSGFAFNSVKAKELNPSNKEEIIEIQEDENKPNMGDLVSEISNNIETNSFDYEVSLYADDWTDTSKYIDAYNNYYDLICKYANTYGIDPNVALAIACHERGVHSNEIDDGGGLGLYQIQVEVWDNNDVKAYNFDTNSWETYTIHTDEIRNLENNIKAGMMIFQDCLIRNDYNMALAIQEYNFGHGGLSKSLDAASYFLGVSRYSLEQNGNLDWLDYRVYNKNAGGFQMGDPHYLENVMKYINNDKILSFTKPDNEILTVKYNNLNMEREVVRN